MIINLVNYILQQQVGGIKSNNNLPVDYLLDNLLIETNLISAARVKNETNFLVRCIYPKNGKNP